MTQIYNDNALSFNDIMLVPQFSNIASRLNVDLSTNVTPSIKTQHPVLSTNMSTITGAEMLREMAMTGSAGLLHRFMDHNQIIHICQQYQDQQYPNLIPSIGIKDQDAILLDKLMTSVNPPPKAVLIDIAHGHSLGVKNMIKHIKEKYPQLEIIAGNVATYQGAYDLWTWGADCVRVGIGGGSRCSTRTQTGHGLPTLQSIISAHSARNDFYNSNNTNKSIYIMADGGIKTPGDIVKALAFGADCVSLGSMLAGSSSTPGDVIYDENNIGYKEFYGMSSHTAQDKFMGIRPGISAEGFSQKVPYSGPTSDILENIIGALRSGLTYSGARNIKELQAKCQYVRITPEGSKESKLQ